jgi:hypothetical protein
MPKKMLEVIDISADGWLMSEAEELVYARGELSVDQLQAEIAQFWQEFHDPPSSALDSELTAAGIDRAALVNVDPRNAISVEARTSGADTTVVLIAVALAPSANRIIKDLWATTLLPRIRRRWGEDAIGKEERGKD